MDFTLAKSAGEGEADTSVTIVTAADDNTSLVFKLDV